MRVVLYGAGAVGSVLGARLARAGEAVRLVARAEHVTAIRESGLYVEGLADAPIHLTAETDLAEGTEAECVILTVKTFDLASAGAALGRRLAGPVPVLAVQNGLRVEAALAAALRGAGWPEPEREIVRGVNSIPATFVAPGRVRLAGDGDIALPTPQGGVDRDRGFGALLSNAGLRVRFVESIDREVWRKVLVNAAINPVSADHRIENGRLSEEPWRGQALALLEEARAVAATQGFDFPEADAQGELFRVVRATARNRSSMLQDLEAGRPTEIDSISGVLLELGRQAGLRIPHTERAVRRIRTLARGEVRRRPSVSPP